MAREADFKSQFLKRLKKEVKPLAVLQYKEDSSTVVGFPDTIVVMPEAITVFIEFKKSKNARFRPLQKEWNQKLNEHLHYSFICYPEAAEEVLGKIKELL